MAENECGCCTAEVSTATPTCYCPVDELLEIASREHALAIVGLLADDGPKRHSEIADALDVNSSSVLANRLRELTEAGLLLRRSYDRVPPHVEYSLTTSGREFERRLRPLLEWVTSEDVTIGTE
jgi:DNA-binding HxlR family transcriptional regulator